MTKPHACCEVETNLVMEGDAKPISGVMGGKQVSGSAIVRKCKVCGARHHEVTAEPGRFGVKGAPAGGA